ncbi:hypothetical protein GJ496_008678 [Pomphorhynchus laevis]|nr:hypothetical protein GJ496_008678 [Pomphorhynchus laevis]
MDRTRPIAVGIVDFTLYVPQLYVNLADLEQWDSVSAGKYTIGLGQNQMAVCSDREDVNSICLTVVHQLIRQANISYSDIGRLEVGTESLIDKSKSVKTVLMQSFSESGNFNVEGVDNLNACYGGTAALFNTVDWIESSAWDGRYGIVVMADIAIYDDKAARPTGGAGAIALLIGPNAPVIIESATRSTVSSHHYDFYKPKMDSPYPVVDGKLTLQCYLNSLLHCYEAFRKKCNSNSDDKATTLSIDDFDAVVFHSPFCGLVRKASALLHTTNLIDCSGHKLISVDQECQYNKESLANFASDKTMQKYLTRMFSDQFNRQTENSLKFARYVGNSYTSSVYMSLVSSLSSMISDEDRKILLFSYGSGYIASMFSVKLVSKQADAIIQHAKSQVNSLFSDKIRIKITPECMEQLHVQRLTKDVAFSPSYPITLIPKENFYLSHIDNRLRRFYNKKEDECVHNKDDEFKVYLESIKAKQ